MPPKRKRSRATKAAEPTESQPKRSAPSKDQEIVDKIQNAIQAAIPDITKAVMDEISKQQTSSDTAIMPSPSAPEGKAANDSAVEPTVNLGISNTFLEAPESISKPLALGIDSKIKSIIWANEFVDFGTLLKPTEKQVKFSIEEGDDGLTFVKEKSTPLKIESIPQWMKAFHIFISIFCERHTNDATKLMKYASIVQKLADQSTASAAIQYDKTFRQWREISPTKLPWDQLNANCTKRHWHPVFSQS
ncbi:uncharacterized protein LOC134231352 [Saccostrea cucullata]|uniref:uncharacterized protein LOC134231352 n=1 Tax=Saccostrea cuccullata TaxID=36930 RepID=UPI002ED5783E